MSAVSRSDRRTADLPLEPEGREKSPQAFRTISEVGEELDIPAHVLRFWETRFPQLNPMKRGGGRRYYRPADVALLRGIRVALYDEGLTIKGLQKIFRERGARHVVALGEGAKLDALPLDALPLDDSDRHADPTAPAAGETQPPADPRLEAVIAHLVALRDRLREA